MQPTEWPVKASASPNRECKGRLSTQASARAACWPGKAQPRQGAASSAPRLVVLTLPHSYLGPP